MKYAFLVLLAFAALACDPNAAKHKANVKIVTDYVRAVESLNYGAMEELLADNYVGYGPSVSDTIYKEQVVASWKKNVESLYESIVYERGQYTGLSVKNGPNQGEWVATWALLTINYKNDEGTVQVMANSNYLVENGRIAKSITFYNEADVMEQLGFVCLDLDDL